jgi:hypothetical protein
MSSTVSCSTRVGFSLDRKWTSRKKNLLGTNTLAYFVRSSLNMKKANFINKFWMKFTYSFCKLDRFSTMGEIVSNNETV